jgi:hypothetical protein
MASVRLWFDELEDYDLPKVCMRCGARANRYLTNRFRWRPWWSWLILLFIGAMIFTRRQGVRVPLCDKHTWHWTGRAVVVGFSLPLVPLFFFGAVVLAAHYNAGGWTVFLPSGLLFLAWAVMAVVLLRITAIRATEITDSSITLMAVSEEFIVALDAERRGEEEHDEGRRHARSRHGDEDEDEDDRPRRRRESCDEDDPRYYDPRAVRRRRVRDEDKDDR